jgi:NAD(P)-dependent dehydrogenase (short-subunit alcohol dehydrogenase family)
VSFLSATCATSWRRAKRRTMKIDGSVALVTGANRGLGQAFARELVSRGAAKVYGAARHPDMVTEPGVTPIALDITDADRVAQVARQCADVSLLVNNAGILKYSTGALSDQSPGRCSTAWIRAASSRQVKGLVT